MEERKDPRETRDEHRNVSPLNLLPPTRIDLARCIRGISMTGSMISRRERARFPRLPRGNKSASILGELSPRIKISAVKMRDTRSVRYLNYIASVIALCFSARITLKCNPAAPYLYYTFIHFQFYATSALRLSHFSGGKLGESEFIDLFAHLTPLK